MFRQIGVYDPGDRKWEDYLWGEPSGVTGDPGDPETNKAVVLREMEELWNQQNLDVLDEIFATSYVRDRPIDDVTTLEDYREFATYIFTLWPDFHLATHDMVAEGDKVASRWTVTATDEGGYFAMEGMRIRRFADGKIVEDWWCNDELGFRIQTGRNVLIRAGFIPPEGTITAVESRTWGQIKSQFQE
jgi:predicted ester cyclase